MRLQAAVRIGSIRVHVARPGRGNAWARDCVMASETPGGFLLPGPTARTVGAACRVGHFRLAWLVARCRLLAPSSNLGSH